MRSSMRLVGQGVIWSALVVAGCGRERPAPGTEAGVAQTAPQVHAPAGVVPGSYEDWCGEHGVPETQCTRCDSTLVAAFQATGDWCAEHALPESQCLLCNPNLVITRPPKPAGS